MRNIEKGLIRVFGVSIAIALSGCASSGVALDEDSAVDIRAQESVALRQSVLQTHESSLMGPDKPWLFAGIKDEAYYRGFENNHCKLDPKTGREISRLQCEQRYIISVNELLSQTYFAADPSALHAICRKEPLICGDLQASEVLFRKFHNAGIEESKREKMEQIEDWKRQKLTDRELESALHLQFKFERGQLVIQG